MTEERKDPTLPDDEALEASGAASAEKDVPELELEDVSWEIEGDTQQAEQDQEPPFQPEEPYVADTAYAEPDDGYAEPGQEAYGGEPEYAYEEQPEDYPATEYAAAEYPDAEYPADEQVEELTLDGLEQDVAPQPEQAPAATPVAPAAAAKAGAQLVDEPYVEEDVDHTADWGWRTRSSGFAPFVFNLHGQTHLFSSRGIEPIAEVAGIGSYFKYLVDYADSTGMGILTLNTESKYAEVLARKQLEEAGELSTDGILHVFSKRKLEGGQISVFYEIFPRDKHVGLVEAYGGYPQGFVILDTVSLLYGLLKREGRGAHVLALHVPGAIIMVAGKNGDVYLSRRYTLVGDDAEALVEGIFALEQDIVALEKNLSQKISHIDWIEGLTSTLNIPRPDVEIPLVPYPVHRLLLNGEQVWSALPSAMQNAPMSAILGPKEERFLRPLELGEKYVWAAMLAVALVAFVGYFYVSNARSEAMERVASLQNLNNSLEQQIQARAGRLAFQDVTSAVQTASEIRLAAISPPLGEMWNFLSSLRPDYIRIDGLEFAYQPSDIAVRLEGQVEMDISVAQHGFVKFVNSLEAQGFTVQSQQIDLGLEGNYYSLNALWPLKKKGD